MTFDPKNIKQRLAAVPKWTIHSLDNYLIEGEHLDTKNIFAVLKAAPVREIVDSLIEEIKGLDEKYSTMMIKYRDKENERHREQTIELVQLRQKTSEQAAEIERLGQRNFEQAGQIASLNFSVSAGAGMLKEKNALIAEMKLREEKLVTALEFYGDASRMFNKVYDSAGNAIGFVPGECDDDDFDSVKNQNGKHIGKLARTTLDEVKKAREG